MRLRIRTLAVVMTLVAAATTAVNAQDAPRAGQLRVVKYNGSMAALLGSLAHSDGVVIGLETYPGKPLSDININLENVTLREIVNGIVQSEPLYQWRETNGVIEVIPVRKTVSLLDTPVDNFEVKDLTSEEAINQLLALPEVQSFATSMKLRRRPETASSDDNMKKISLKLSAVSVREVLSSIAAESGAMFWRYRTFRDGSFSLGTSSSN